MGAALVRLVSAMRAWITPARVRADLERLMTAMRAWITPRPRLAGGRGALPPSPRRSVPAQTGRRYGRSPSATSAAGGRTPGRSVLASGGEQETRHGGCAKRPTGG